MKLTLISPKGVGMGTNEENRWTQALYDSLAGIDSLRELMSCANAPLLTVASILEPFFDSIEYIDEEIENIDWNAHYDMVAMSFMTQQASRAFVLAERFREKGVYRIAGGMHPTNSPEETLRYLSERGKSRFPSSCRTISHKSRRASIKTLPKSIWTPYPFPDMTY